MSDRVSVLADHERVLLDQVRVSPDQYARIRKIIQLHHEALVEAVAGRAAVPAAVEAEITAMRIPRWIGAPATQEACNLGILLAGNADPFTDLTHEEFRKRLAHRREIPQSLAEAEAERYASESAAVYCRGLGNTVDKDTASIIQRATAEEREAVRQGMRTEVAEAVHWRETAGELKQRLGRASGDWNRDLQRIATTELNNAHQLGRGAAIETKHGAEALVAKIPNARACETCREFYTEDGGRPRIYKLAEIKLASNVGKKRADWVPTLEGLHPWCGCAVVHVPRGMAFNAKRQLVPEIMAGGQVVTEVPSRDPG